MLAAKYNFVTIRLNSNYTDKPQSLKSNLSTCANMKNIDLFISLHPQLYMTRFR